ncbi:hypothetical protein LCGC14_0893900 [marine sediment metagenome]|uniref:Right handed beta helix domain-containing protein n=1 Tax=marine sediment metagenome TaxID=412755 RepID=A0A0F9S5B3_9ZZZZ
MTIPNDFWQPTWLGGTVSIAMGENVGFHWFVNSVTGDSTFPGKSWLKPLATIDQAVDKAAAGDVIYVAPVHVENLAADSAIDIDVAGVSVVGVRRGRLMPTLTNTHADGDCKLAAAGVSVRNLRFLGGVDIGTGIITVSGADCAILDCEYRDSVGQATDVILTVDGSDRLLIDGFHCFGAAGAGGNSAIAVDGSDDIEIRSFYLHGNFAVGAIDFRTTLSARVNVHSGKIWTRNAADIAIVDTITSSTGFIGPDIQIMLTDDAANITTAVTGATFQLMDPVYVCNAVDEKGLLINWTASTHA